ncbi:hypothetical protein [Vagococcus silagei]|uniref:Uncharacterized protein n=1 Tax=Vagococcus silagei TaxID=2508885 RepID=A0A4S3B6A0_9ENTE|nr:hypothetical protein [Vagococcus silagei]THB60135.1 hypothetical protein ESZ54_12020 [Vagococcus silagei]
MDNILSISKTVIDIIVVLFTIGSLQNMKVNPEEKKNSTYVSMGLFVIATLVLYVGNVLLGQEQKASVGLLDAISIVSVIYLFAYQYFLKVKKSEKVTE